MVVCICLQLRCKLAHHLKTISFHTLSHTCTFLLLQSHYFELGERSYMKDFLGVQVSTQLRFLKVMRLQHESILQQIIISQFQKRRKERQWYYHA